jgi:hypothetical protein
MLAALLLGDQLAAFGGAARGFVVEMHRRQCDQRELRPAALCFALMRAGVGDRRLQAWKRRDAGSPQLDQDFVGR